MAITLSFVSVPAYTKDNTIKVSARVTQSEGWDVSLFVRAYGDNLATVYPPIININELEYRSSGSNFSLTVPLYIGTTIMDDGEFGVDLGGVAINPNNPDDYDSGETTRQSFKDTLRPQKPICYIHAVTPTTARVTWSSFSDPAPSSGYNGGVVNLERWNGSAWVSAGSKSFTPAAIYVEFTGLGGDPYRAQVRHDDKAGNNSYYSDYKELTLNSAPGAPTIKTPAANGSTINQRPKVIANVPTDADGNTVKVKAVFKNAGTTKCTVESGYVTQGTGTVTLTPTADLGTGTISVELSAHDGTEWSTTNTYTFSVVAAPTFPVLDAHTSISAVTLNNLTTWINNARQFRGLAAFSFTDGDVTKNVTQIKKVHLDERREKTTEVLAVVGVTPVWTDPVITAGVTERRGIHWTEIFNYLKQI